MNGRQPPEKIKVLHVITRLEKGGAPSVLLEILRRCDRERFEYHIATGITRHTGNDMIPIAQAMGIRVFVIPTLVRDIQPLSDVRALMQLYFLIRKGGYGIVHCHTSKGGFVGRLAAWLARARVILYSPHGDIFEGYFGGLKTRLFILLERFAAVFTDKIITLTQSGIAPYLAAKIGNESQFEFIYNGIDSAALERRRADRPQKRNELSVANDAFLVATAGRLVPVKGYTYLITALSRTVKEIPNVRLVFLGDGELREGLVRQARELGLEDHALFPGMRNDVPEILSCSDLFVLPSLNEGFGVVLLEAMAMRLPIVATRVGGIPEVVLDGETGVLVSPRDPEALAGAMIRLFKDPALAGRMGEGGYRRLKAYFDIRETIAKTERLYRELLGISG